MKYCSKCGKEVNEDAVVCVNCGCALNGAQKSNAQKKLNAMSLVGFIVSLASIFITLVGIVPIAGIVFSSIGLKQLKANEDQKGKGFAVTGLVVGICSLIYTVVAVIILGMLLGALATL